MARSTRVASRGRRRAVVELLVYGVAYDLLVAVVELIELRFLVVEPSVAVYGAMIAVPFGPGPVDRRGRCGAARAGREVSGIVRAARV